MKQLFIDIETTGLDFKKDKIREIGCIYRKDGKIIKSILITDNIYSNFIKFLDSCVNKFDKTDKLYFLAYNGAFDSNFIRQMFEDNKNKFFGSYFYNPLIDIMQVVAFKFMVKGIRPENFKLGTIAKHLKIKVDENKLHNALYDAEIMKSVYNKILKK